MEEGSGPGTTRAEQAELHDCSKTGTTYDKATAWHHQIEDQQPAA
jgi:hypothetical protein